MLYKRGCVTLAKKQLSDYFDDYRKLYHELQNASDATEVARITLLIEQLKKEVERKYSTYDKNGTPENI